MTQPWWRRFRVKGVFWRQILRWAVLNVPIWIEPLVIAWWSAFFLLWGPGRRGVMRNLAAIKPGSSPIANFFRTYRVFWNYAWTITDNIRHREQEMIPDWQFDGIEHFEETRTLGAGAIILTAHMGSYDLGASLFAQFSMRKIVVVRAPEVDPDTQQYEESNPDNRVRAGFHTAAASDLALDLLDSVRNGEIIAITGDRVTPAIASIEGRLFGKPFRMPSGPFALAMASRAPIFPMFIMRRGRRRYELRTTQPIIVTRTSRNRDEDIRRAAGEWTRHLESAVSAAWQQWFAFEPFYEERSA